jgi:hypothetical protein
MVVVEMVHGTHWCPSLIHLLSQTTFPEYKQKEFSVRRRYKDFVWLRNHLKEKLNERGKRLTLAELPGNTVSSFLGPGKERERERERDSSR